MIFKPKSNPTPRGLTMREAHPGPPSYEKIYQVIRRIPCGKVATYGQIAKLVGRCSARMVGYALAALGPGSDVPWQRVLNCKGTVSPRSRGDGAWRQRRCLEAEGVVFDSRGRVDFGKFRWGGSLGRGQALRRKGGRWGGLL